LESANAGRQARLAEELAVMRPLPPNRLAEYRELFGKRTPSPMVSGRGFPGRMTGSIGGPVVRPAQAA
jgi:hypothetical protein